jgi:hypothetical protein
MHRPAVFPVVHGLHHGGRRRCASRRVRVQAPVTVTAGAIDALEAGLVTTRRIGIADEILAGDLQLACLREHGEIVQQRHPERPGPRIPREDVRDRYGGPRVSKEHCHDLDERRGRRVDAALMQHRGIKVADRAAAGFRVITGQCQELPRRVRSRP